MLLNEAVLNASLSAVIKPIPLDKCATGRMLVLAQSVALNPLRTLKLEKGDIIMIPSKQEVLVDKESKTVIYVESNKDSRGYIYIDTSDLLKVQAFYLSTLTRDDTYYEVNSFSRMLSNEVKLIMYTESRRMKLKFNKGKLTVGALFGTKKEDMYVYRPEVIIKPQYRDSTDRISSEELFAQYNDEDAMHLIASLPGMARHYNKLLKYTEKSDANKKLIEELGEQLFKLSDTSILCEAYFDKFTLVAYYQAVFGTRVFQILVSRFKGNTELLANHLIKKFPYSIPAINDVGYGLISLGYSEYGSEGVVSRGYLPKPNKPIVLDAQFPITK